ncbi:protein of unknown function [Nitrospira japonica]|uniref:Uncharacterized protein n=1 Tax=Nitrospira japonica TaxID=1325564 RepID=A0A1W1I0D8_9BACT|nr:protein of unknown function [Nitrospira japonica]
MNRLFVTGDAPCRGLYSRLGNFGNRGLGVYTSRATRLYLSTFLRFWGQLFSDLSPDSWAPDRSLLFACSQATLIALTVTGNAPYLGACRDELPHASIESLDWAS